MTQERKKIIFVTTNAGKIKSAQRAMPHIDVEPYHYDLIEPRSDDIEEIAKEKVRQAFAVTGQACIALDAGFYIKRWKGFPRAYVHPALQTLGIEGLLKLMEGEEDRECHFRQCLAFYDGNHFQVFESSTYGTLAPYDSGVDHPHAWSDLWRIFVPEGYDQTISEMSHEELEGYYASAKPSSTRLFGQWYAEEK